MMVVTYENFTRFKTFYWFFYDKPFSISHGLNLNTHKKRIKSVLAFKLLSLIVSIVLIEIQSLNSTQQKKTGEKW